MQKKWTVLGGRRAYNLYCQSSRFFIITERYIVCISLIILISFLADNLATHIIIPVDRCFFGQPILCKEFLIVFILALNKIPHIFQFLFEQHILKKSESTFKSKYVEYSFSLLENIMKFNFFNKKSSLQCHILQHAGNRDSYLFCNVFKYVCHRQSVNQIIGCSHYTLQCSVVRIFLSSYILHT